MPDRVWKGGEDGEVGITNRFITTDQSHSDHAAFYPIGLGRRRQRARLGCERRARAGRSPSHRTLG
jgi:hypothetical protein